MPILNDRRFGEDLNLARSSTSTMKSIVQNLLVTACYHAFKDGNTTPLNSILDMAVNSKAIDVSRITRWVELHAGIARVHKEQFRLNKKVRDDSCVTDEASFTQYEDHLRALSWYDIAKKPVAKSVFDLEAYIGTAIKQVEKHEGKEGVEATSEQFAMVLKELKSIKGKLAQLAIE